MATSGEPSTSQRLKTLATRVAHPVISLKEMSRPKDSLTVLANRYGSDKGDLHFNRHKYTRIYSKLFAPLRMQAITFLEIGLLHPHVGPAKPAAKPDAPSLRMWSSYFPSANVIGFDIADFAGVSIPRCSILRGDAGSRADLGQLSRHAPFDVVIDDASHASRHQQIALAALFPLVKDGGLYIIEDLHWQPKALEDPAVPKTRDVLRRAEVTGELASPLFTDIDAAYLRDHVSSVELFDSADECTADFRDAVAILRKTSR